MTAIERQRIGELAEAVIAGDIAEADFSELCGWLDRDESARQLYVRQMAVDSMLTGLLEGGNGVGRSHRSSGGEGVVEFSGKWKQSIAWAAAAVLMLAAVGVIGTSLRKSEPDTVAANGSTVDFGTGQRLELAEGEQQAVRLPSGVVANVQGAATFVVTADNAVRLLSGQAEFLVPNGAEGFRVQVPWGEVIDLGTIFHLAIGPGQETKIQVQAGRVQAISDIDGSVAEINAGDVAFLASSGSRRDGGATMVAGSRPSPGEVNRDRGYRVGNHTLLADDLPPVAHWDFTGKEETWLIEDGGVHPFSLDLDLPAIRSSSLGIRRHSSMAKAPCVALIGDRKARSISPTAMRFRWKRG